MLSRLRARAAYANVVATVALLAATCGVSYAAIHVGSRQIVNNSVRSKDIGNNDVRSKDIRAGGVATSDLAAKARGVAIAGADISLDGTVVKWFNRAGGKPTVDDHTSGSGEYTLGFPGVVTANTLVSVSSGTGQVEGGSTGGPGSHQVFVGGFPRDGTVATDEQFYILLYPASASG